MGNIPPSIVRQPPQPPPRHQRLLMAADNEERMIEMVGGRCKRKRLMNLCNDMQLEVLVHLPARDIYEQARFVCRKWYHMIRTHNFIYAHLQHSTYGLLFHSVCTESMFIAVEQGRIEISKLRKFRWSMSTSCNGLILEFDFHSNPNNIYITNPVTKQMFVLPPIFHRVSTGRLCAIAYAAASMEYKVVALLPPGPNTQPCCILTVGVDNSWRIVPTDHLSRKAEMAFLYFPLTTEGFIHWTRPDNHVLTLNVETEIITETHVPIGQVGRTYLSTGRFLSLLIKRRKFSWQVWEMKPETGEWRNLPDIALGPQKVTFFQQFGFERDRHQLFPIGWLKYPEVIVFRFSHGDLTMVFPYNLLTLEIHSIKLPTYTTFCSTIVHKNSLVWSAGF